MVLLIKTIASDLTVKANDTDNQAKPNCTPNNTMIHSLKQNDVKSLDSLVCGIIFVTLYCSKVCTESEVTTTLYEMLRLKV